MSIRFFPVDCQGNYAATVRVIMPFGSNAGRAASTLVWDRNGGDDSYLRQKTGMETVRPGIIELTAHWTKPGGSHDYHHGCEVCRTPAARRSQSPSRSCDRFLVSPIRVLRHARSRPGQVRDAAACSTRRTHGHGGVRGLRMFAVRVLRSQGGLSARRIASSDPSPARSSTPAQVEWTGPGLPSRTAWSRPVADRGYVSTTRPRSVWSECPSPQHRTGAGSPAKKGAALLPAVADAHELWAARYEDLRKRALTFSEADSEAGWEQVLVIRQGLRAWMDVWPQAHATRPAPASPTPSTISSDPDLALSPLQQSQLAQILASMILHSRSEVLS
jgi:hypothetical protein